MLRAICWGSRCCKSITSDEDEICRGSVSAADGDPVLESRGLFSRYYYRISFNASAFIIALTISANIMNTHTRSRPHTKLTIVIAH